MLSAVFLWQLLDERSFFSAIRGVELRKLSHKPGEGDGPTWNDVYDDFENALKVLPCLRPHFAAKQALVSVIRAEHRRQPAGELLPSVAQCREIDPGNWVIRLSQACLADMARPPTANDAATLQARFAAMKQIVESAPPPDKSTLYNQEFTEAWHTALKKHIKRADVAANVATGEQDPRIFIVEHYEALPMIQRRLFDLSQLLRKAGQPKEAEECIRWIAALTLGLMQADRDAGTRLLAADMLEQSMSTDPTANRPLADLCASYRRRTSYPADFSDQLKRPKIPCDSLPGDILSNLILAGHTFCVATGAMLVWFVASLVAVFHRVWLRTARATNDRSGLRVFPVLALCFILGQLPLMPARNQAPSWFSEEMALVYCIYCAGCGCILAIVIADLAQFVFVRKDETAKSEAAKRERLRWRIRLLFLIPCAVLSLPIVGVSRVAAVLHSLALHVGLEVTLLLALTLGAALVLPLTRCSLRVRTTGACMVWVFFAAVATVQLPFMLWSDSDQQRATSNGRMDEFSARLGPDWQDRYLLSALRAYDLAHKPTTTAP